MLRKSVRFGRILHRAALVVCGAALLVGSAGAAAAQAAGQLQGHVVDAETGRPVVGARLLVVGTNLGATTVAQGRYTISGIPAGTHSVQVSALGHAVKTVTGIAVGSGSVAELDVTVSPAALAIAGLTVSAAAERGSASRALDEQRTAVNVTSAISREEIERGPDGDAAAAVRRVSGVTVEGGKYVFVRGLGERYTTTQLNGVRLPSAEPDRRVVPLDLFPAGTLEGITVSKTFTPDQAGDFSGAQVNLRTRNFTSPFRSGSFSIGFNDAVTFRDVLLPPTVGVEWLGFATGARDLPAELRGGVGNLTTAQQAAALSGFRNLWMASPETAMPNLSASLSTGSRVTVAGRPVQLLGAISYRAGTEARFGETRVTPTLRGTETVALNEYTADVGRRSVVWGGVLNLASTVGESTRLQFNNTYDRTADNEALRMRGTDEQLATDLDISRLQFVERTVFSSQLAANHDWDGDLLDWSATVSRVTRHEPDRSELVYIRDYDVESGQSPWAYFGGATAPTTRAFGGLTELSAAAQADYTRELGSGGSPALLKLGTLYRYTARDAETRSFDFENIGLSLDDRTLPPEQIFGGRFYDPANPAIRLRANVFGGEYAAEEHVGAGYGMVELPLGSRVEFVGGARLEAARLDVASVDVSGTHVPAELATVDLLPSAALNVRLSPDQNLRFSVARTLSRPEYREMANLTYREYVGDLLVFGNPELKRALIDNLDLRWEFYPSGGEVMSVGLFAKRFRHPIERVFFVGTGAPALSYRNAKSAESYGVELELRRRLGFVAEPLDAFTLGANATLVRSEVDFGGTDAAEAATSASRPLLGQAPYVANLSLIYEAPNDASATLLLNSIGERVTEVGLGGIPDAYDQPRTTLDFAAEYPLRAGTTVRLEAENLLDSVTEVRQGGLTRLRYRNGRSFSVGFSMQP